LVFHSSTIAMMHGPINIRLYKTCPIWHCEGVLERNSGTESGILLAKRTYSPSLLSLLVNWICPQTCFRWKCYQQTFFFLCVQKKLLPLSGWVQS